MGLFGFGKKKGAVVSKRELVGLEADLHENYPKLIARLQVEFNKNEGIKNKWGRFIKFYTGELETLKSPDLRYSSAALFVSKDKSRRNFIWNVKSVVLIFFLEGIPKSWIKNKYDIPIEDLHHIFLLPVYDHNVPCWGILYQIRNTGVYRSYAQKFTSLSEDGLFIAVRDLVVNNSVGWPNRKGK
ncbi:hypothetical protein HY495_03865 [Candidatus Woesearchaeota archaeon]|nr:hypothetical protein [Candidatus Woesearchaeota archaeon]